jgi:hypothetical protein
MKRVAEIYAMSFNRRNSRSGSLWEGRFGSSVVQDGSYLFNCYRYIEMNPVRAGSGMRRARIAHTGTMPFASSSRGARAAARTSAGVAASRHRSRGLR